MPVISPITLSTPSLPVVPTPSFIVTTPSPVSIPFFGVLPVAYLTSSTSLGVMFTYSISPPSLPPITVPLDVSFTYSTTMLSIQPLHLLLATALPIPTTTLWYLRILASQLPRLLVLCLALLSCLLHPYLVLTLYRSPSPIVSQRRYPFQRLTLSASHMSTRQLHRYPSQRLTLSASHMSTRQLHRYLSQRLTLSASYGPTALNDVMLSGKAN